MSNENNNRAEEINRAPETTDNGQQLALDKIMADVFDFDTPSSVADKITSHPDRTQNTQEKPFEFVQAWRDANQFENLMGDGKAPEANDSALRQKLLGMTSEQIAAADAAYAQQHGRSLADGLQDSALSDTTKAMLSTLMKGRDNISAEEYGALAQTALDSKDAQLFGDVMKGMPHKMREQLQGLQSQLEGAFEGKDLSAAKDYLQWGRLSTAHKIEYGDGMFATQQKRIDFAIANMPIDEQNAYAQGRRLTQNPPTDREMTTQEKQAKEYYDRLRGTLHQYGTKGEAEAWETKILNGHHEKSVLVTGSLMSRNPDKDSQPKNVPNDGGQVLPSDFNKAEPWRNSRPKYDYELNPLGIAHKAHQVPGGRVGSVPYFPAPEAQD